MGLTVKKYETREEMGCAAAFCTIDAIKKVLEVKNEVNMFFAAAPSQNELLANLI